MISKKIIDIMVESLTESIDSDIIKNLIEIDEKEKERIRKIIEGRNTKIDDILKCVSY